MTNKPHNVVKTFPQRGEFQQYRLGSIAEFVCARCGEAKKSKLVAVRRGNKEFFCNSCYGWHLVKADK